MKPRGQPGRLDANSGRQSGQALPALLDALDDNPVRELTPAPRKRKSERRADRKVVLTVDRVAGLRAHVAASAAAERNDLVDVVDVLTGLGCRIGELLALDWPKLDFARGRLTIAGTVIRVRGEGLVVQPHEVRSRDAHDSAA